MPEPPDGRSPLSQLPVVWIVVGVAVIVFICIGLMGMGVLLAVVGGQRQEAQATLPPPATLTPTAVVPTAEATLVPAAPVDGQVTAVQLPTAPTIDGDLTEWGSRPGFTSEYIVAQADSWDGTMDVSAVWRLGWDAQHLYLAVSVSDDRHVQAQETKFAYLGDSLELQFDTNIEADYGAAVSSDDYQYVISPGDFGGREAGAFRFRGTADGNMSDFIGSQARVAVTQTTDGYDLEMRLPWSDIGLQPTAGMEIGAAFSLNDLDTAGTAVQELMLSHVSTRRWRDPTSWGSLRLISAED